MARNPKTYSSYLEQLKKGSSNVHIPYSTWTRWLKKGQITEEKLNSLGIKTNQRKRTPRVRIAERQDSGLGQDQAQSDNGPADENLQVFGGCSGASSSQSDGEDSIASVQSDNESDTFSSSDSDCSVNITDASFESCGSSTCDDSDTDCNDGMLAHCTRLVSILKSKHIGTSVMNEKLHEHLSVTKFEVLMMILHLSMRHRMTDVFVEHLFKFVDSIIGIPNSLGMTNYLFNKLFTFDKQTIEHFYCPNCMDYIGLGADFADKDVACLKEECDWSSSASSHNSGNYFLTLELRSQVADVLVKPDIKFVSKQRTENVETDMMDGLEYQHVMRDRIFTSHPDALTLTLSTDGSPVFKSGNTSLWPVHFYINEIDPSQRFHAENIMLAGVWFGTSPNIQVFMKPIIQELVELETSGVIWTKPDGTTVESPIFVMCCCTDSVARPKVQCHMQFNGAYACTICEHPNTEITVEEKIKIKNKNQRGTKRKRQDGGGDDDDDGFVIKPKKMCRYLRDTYPLRSNESLREHMELADTSLHKDHIMGSLGKSVFCELKQFDVVYGFVIDYMHAVLLGTVKRLANLWFDSTSNGKPYYIGLKISRVNMRLATITLPIKFRPPRPMSDRVHWKANEWRAFLLYFGLVVLQNILPMDYYNHFKKLVSAIYILSKDAILKDEVVYANELLSQFVYEYQDLYGEVNMVYNVHMTGHLARLVARMGPLWAYSAFPFESANGRLVKLATGTKGVATQICRKYIMTTSDTKLFSHGYKVERNILKFCCEVVGHEYLKNSSKGQDNETLLGRVKYRSLNDIQKQAFLRQNLPAFKTVVVSNRVIIEKQQFCGRLTTRQVRACDSCVRLNSGEYALIDLIIVNKEKLDDNNLTKTSLLVTKLNIATDAASLLLPHIKQCSIDAFGDVVLVSLSEVVKKCIFYSCNEKKYVAEYSNFYETD